MDSTLTTAPDLVQTVQKTFYPQSIPQQHHQLRHFLKTTESGITYYATQQEAYALKDGKRKLIARLDFVIKCLAAGFGWLCMGGAEKGQCAFLRLEMRDAHDAADRSDTDVDTLLPLNLRPSERSDSPEGLRRLRAASYNVFPQRAKTVHYKNIGEEIVNAITLQTIPSARSSTKQETVAVIAKNDTTVSIFSLDKLETLYTLHFRYLMNHATLSADGKTLIACGDINRVFFYKRKKSQGRLLNEWEELVNVAIPSFSEDDHCFTTGITPDQRHCTIASQAGHMVRFDFNRVHAGMRDGEGIVDVIASSRPLPTDGDAQSWKGAIRSTTFSPSVWGMYAWAEGKGRICVGDLRNPNRPPQVVKLSDKDPKNNKIDLTDASSEDDLDDEDEPFSQTLRRYGISRPASTTVRDQLNEVSSAVDYLEDAAQLRRLQQVLRSLDRDLDRDTSGLLEDQPRLHDLMNEIQEMGEELENSAATRGQRVPPRRRSSVLFNHNERTTPPPANASLAPGTVYRPSTLSASPSQLPREPTPADWTPPQPLSHSSTADSSDPWQTISAAMNADQSRQESTQAQQRIVRETQQRAMLESQQRALREARQRMIREEQNASERPQRDIRSTDAYQQQMMLLERQNRARLRAANRPPGSYYSNSNSPSTSQTTRTRAAAHARDSVDAEDRLQADLEQTLDESTSRLSQLEREIDRLESTRLLMNRGPSQTITPEEIARLRTTSPPSITPLRSAHGTTYQRILGPEAAARRLRGESTLIVRPRSGYEDEQAIMGLDWSWDGRTLFVATTSGIYELKVNLKGRLATTTTKAI